MSKKNGKNKANNNHQMPWELRKEVCRSCTYKCRNSEDSPYSPRNPRKIQMGVRFYTAILHHYCRHYDISKKMNTELEMLRDE